MSTISIIGQTNSSNALFLNNSNGFVGIGKSNPGYALDVAGTINCTGSVLVNGAALSLGGGGSSVQGPAFRVTMSNGSVNLNATNMVIPFNTKVYDTTSAFNTSTYKFQPTTAGYYIFTGWVEFAMNSGVAGAIIYKNGSRTGNSGAPTAGSTAGTFGVTISDTLYLNGTTDYVQMYAFCNGNGTFYGGNDGSIVFCGTYTGSSSSGGSSSNPIAVSSWYVTLDVSSSSTPNNIFSTSTSSTTVLAPNNSFQSGTMPLTLYANGQFTCTTAGTFSFAFDLNYGGLNTGVNYYINRFGTSTLVATSWSPSYNTATTITIYMSPGDYLYGQVYSGTVFHNQNSHVFVTYYGTTIGGGGSSQFTTYASSNIYLAAGSNLAIGKSNAIAALDVAGNINFTGNLMNNGSNLVAQSSYQISYVFQPSANTTGPAFVGATGSTTVLKYTDTYNNAATALNTSTATFTAPVSGTYMVSAYNIENLSGLIPATMYVSVNGSTTDTTYAINVENDTEGNASSVSYPISLSTGNTIQFYVASGGVYGSAGAGGIASKGRYSVALMSMNASLGLVPTTGMGVPNQVVFTSGSSTWTVPTGVTAVQVEMVGGGGSGSSPGSANATPGGGGGAGQYMRITFPVSSNGVISYTVGTGGTALAAVVFNTAGNTGNNTIMSYANGGTTYMTATCAGGGGGGAANGSTTTGFSGVGGSSGTITSTLTYSQMTQPGGDGQSGSITGTGTPGNGGSSYFGGGGGWNGSTAALAGKSYGSGGCGAQNSLASGAGASGVIIITYFTQSGLPLNYTATAPLSMTGTSLTIANATSNAVGVVQPDNITTTVSSAGILAAAAPFRNRIINGDMRIDQRNAGAAITTTGYAVDRFSLYQSTTSGTFSIGQSNLPTALSGYTKCLKLTGSSINVTGATNYMIVVQHIEGYNVADLMWGTGLAQTVTLSFWVYGSTATTYSVGIHNANDTRAYMTNYNTVANTWQYVTVTIPGDTTGTWATENSKGISVIFSFGAGSSNQTTANAWAGGNYLGTSSTSSLASSTVYITGVQLEKGSIATPFEFRPYAIELQLCQRYYLRFTPATGQFLASGHMRTTTIFDGPIVLPTPLRATVNLSGSVASGLSLVHSGGANPVITSMSGSSYAGSSVAYIRAFIGSALTAGYGAIVYLYTPDYIEFNAEL